MANTPTQKSGDRRCLVWEQPMLDRLVELRSKQRMPLYICAEKIGVSYASAVYKARELNLAQRMNSGRRPGHGLP
jgi:hypothetical protein